jgi:hypothetical protein
LLALLASCAAPSSPGDDAAQEIARPIAFDAALWQAARETVDFLPLEATDPITGTIETGWGSPHGVFDQRFKITVHLTYERVYSGAAEVQVRRQLSTPDGWIDAVPDPKMAQGIARDIAKEAKSNAQLHKGE